MKTISFKIILFLFIASIMACSEHQNKKEKNSSNENKDEEVITENRNIENFNKIEIDGVFNVVLSQGNDVALKIEAEKEILAEIISEVKDGTLVIKMQRSADFSDDYHIKIFIQVNDLKSLTTAGVGAVRCEQTLKLEQFKLQCNGVGATNLKIMANSLLLNSESIGAITLSGKVATAEINHNGVGILNAFDLITQTLKLTTSGVGASEVYASEQIEINANGIGSVQFKGNPKVKNIKSDGIGKVSAVD